jgi:hypothetical protein
LLSAPFIPCRSGPANRILPGGRTGGKKVVACAGGALLRENACFRNGRRRVFLLREALNGGEIHPNVLDGRAGVATIVKAVESIDTGQPMPIEPWGERA